MLGKDSGSVKSVNSRASRHSRASQLHKRFNSIEHLETTKPIEVIPEEDQLTVVDRNGNKIPLN